MHWNGSEDQHNGTFRGLYTSPIPAWLLLTINTLVIGAVILGNGVLIISFAVVPSLRKVSNYFVVSLAVADLMAGIVSIPIMFGAGTITSWIVCVVYFSADISICCVSVLHILAINTDRYLAITRPLHYPTIVTPGRVAWVIPCLWMLGVGASVANTFSGAVDFRNCNAPSYTKAGSMISLFCLFFIPFTATSLIYFRIYCLVAEHLKAMQKPSVAVSTLATANEPAIRNPERNFSLPTFASPTLTVKSTNTERTPNTTGTQPDRKQSSSGQMSNRKAIKAIALILGIFGVAWGKAYILLTMVSFYPRLLQNPVFLGFGATSTILVYVSFAFIYGFIPVIFDLLLDWF